MAVVGNEIWVEFAGGIHSNLHPAKIDESELANGENSISRDGTAQLDQRYIEVGDTGESEVQGSGYGKYQGDEEYLVVAGNHVYSFDIGNDLVMTSIATSSAIADGDWLMEQFEGYIYLVNEAAYLCRKTIGASTFEFLKRPTKPAAAPASTRYQPEYSTMTLTGGSVGTTGGAVTGTITNGQLRIVTTGSGTKTVTVTLASSFDAEYRDTGEFRIVRSATSLPIPGVSVSEGAGTTDYGLSFWYGFDGGRTPDASTGYFRLQGIPRSSRNAITTITFTIEAPTGTNTWTISAPKLFGVWLTLPTNYNPGSGDAVLQPYKVAYTYVDTTGLESEPSPKTTVTPAFQQPLGEWRNVAVIASAESDVNKIRIYRIDGEAGNEVYYQLTELSNAGATYVDKLPLNEVQILATYNPSQLPQEDISCITTWQNRLVLGVGNLVQISRSDDETSFPPLSGVVDDNDVGNGLVFYPDDKKAETVLGLASGDALTIITDRSVRALFGTIPQNWRQVKLNCEEGAVGKRAWISYQQGAVIFTPSGRLLYVALGLDNPIDLSAKVRDRIGYQNIKALATSDAVVAVRPDGQIEVRNQTGAYYIIDVDQAIRKGTHTHPTHSLLFAPGLPIRWMGTDGRLFEGGSDDYVTDGGLIGNDGTEVEFYVETREWSLPRCSIESIYIRAPDHHVNPNNRMVAPRVEVRTRERTKEYIKKMGKDTIITSIRDSGERLQLKLTGDRFTPITDVRVRMRPLARADQK